MDISQPDFESPSTSGLSSWGQKASKELVSLNLSIMGNTPANEEEMDDDENEMDDVEVNEDERIQLQKVSSLVDAAYQRVEKFSQYTYKITAYDTSENSSCLSAGTPFLASSLPESIEAGRMEIEELKSQSPSLETALRVNQTLQRKFLTTLNQLEITLQKNLLRQNSLEDEIENFGVTQAKVNEGKEFKDKYHVRPSTFAMPYFKHRSGAPAPMNYDSKYKVTNGHLDLYSTKLRTWLTSEQNTLIKEVQFEWKDHLVEEWKQTLKTIERKMKDPLITEDETAAIEEEKCVCQNHITFFQNVSADKIEVPLESQLDWNKIAVTGFDGSRSAEECQLIWENYLHPTINKNPFSEKEDVGIQTYMLDLEESGKPDWEILAKKLNSGRTAYQVFKRWVSYIRPANFPAKWTQEASDKLKDLVTMLRVGSHIPWHQIAQYFTGFTKVQLRTRWRNIKPEQSRGRFNLLEDFVLVKGLFKFGTNFELIAHFLNGRSRTQVKERFQRAVMPGIAVKPWKWKEDKIIIENAIGGKTSWQHVSKFLPRRNVSQVKMRYVILHFWESISRDKDKLPPPLFPLSMTDNPQEIKILRKKILEGQPDLKVFLDTVKKNQNTDELVKSYEEAIEKSYSHRKQMRNTQSVSLNQDSSQFDEKTLNKSATSAFRIRGWFDQSLIEFFLPGRPNPSPKFSPRDRNVNLFFHRVSQALQLKVPCDVISRNEMQLLQSHFMFDEFDVRLVNNILIRHHMKKNYGRECVACAGDTPKVMPFLPPSVATVGALRSLLLNQPVLTQMSQRDFFFFKVPPSQICKFDQPGSMSIKKELINDESGLTEDSEQVSVTRKRRRKAAAKAEKINQVFIKMENERISDKRGNKEIAIDPPTPEELNQMLLGHEVPMFKKRSFDSEEESNLEAIKKQEDDLLFRRMVSLFFWPALFTLQKPSEDLSNSLEEVVKEKVIYGIEKGMSNTKLIYTQKQTSKFPTKDLKEHELKIKKMEAVRAYKAHQFQTVLKRHDVDVSLEDMKNKYHKKKIISMKRSLVFKKVWANKKAGKDSGKIGKKTAKARTRPPSSRIASKVEQKRKMITEEGKNVLLDNSDENGVLMDNMEEGDCDLVAECGTIKTENESIEETCGLIDGTVGAIDGTDDPSEEDLDSIEEDLDSIEEQKNKKNEKLKDCDKQYPRFKQIAEDWDSSEDE